MSYVNLKQIVNPYYLQRYLEYSRSFVCHLEICDIIYLSHEPSSLLCTLTHKKIN